MNGVLLAALIAAAIVLIALGVRYLYHLHPRPCPTPLIWCLKNPLAGRYRADVLKRLELSPGMSVLDAGCGPGLLTVPLGQSVGPQGRVTALDIQPAMLELARAAAVKRMRFMKFSPETSIRLMEETQGRNATNGARF